ncbi:MAG: hypothetical protein JKY66_06565 [Spongiibacteraceae bacterium]|nr:hypothetical protein [Spongiibacteraceae bacterium]
MGTRGKALLDLHRTLKKSGIVFLFFLWVSAEAWVGGRLLFSRPSVAMDGNSERHMDVLERVEKIKDDLQLGT